MILQTCGSSVLMVSIDSVVFKLFMGFYIALSDCVSIVRGSTKIIESLPRELTEFLSSVSSTDGWSDEDRVSLSRLFLQLQKAS
jgi:hypothetical protein